jgi:N-formylglutamate deformylase
MSEISFIFRPGNSALVLGMPHAGTTMPEAIAASMTLEALAQPDTAHHVKRLTDFAVGGDITTIESVYCRYVIDLNRSPDGLNRFAGTNNTTLCTVERFDHAPIYLDGVGPDAEEVGRRLQLYWQPYHAALAAALETARATLGCAVLLDIHTIPPDVARFYDTLSPHFSLKSGAGICAAPELVRRVEAALAEDDHYEVETDGRFKGGYIVQHYGDPARGVHSLQIEISQANYLHEDGSFDPVKAMPLRRRLIAAADAVIDWASIQRELPH